MDESRTYDVVIVGAGIAGAIIANEMAKEGKSVLVLEAGPRDTGARQTYQQAFLKSWIKLPEIPYPPYAPDPSDPYTFDPAKQNAPRYNSAMFMGWPTLDSQCRTEQIDKLNSVSSITYTHDSELPFLSTYERILGGTTWHWLGTAVRLLPKDFKLQTNYGHGVDWPITYEDLMPDYQRAEATIGVSGDVATQDYGGLQFEPGYQYPSPWIPPTYSDTQLNEGVQGSQFQGIDIRVTTTPQGRKSRDLGDGRPACRGNTSCIPICPIQAKWDATVELAWAKKNGDVTVIEQAVASRVVVDTTTGRVSGVEYIKYDDPTVRPSGPPQTAVGTMYVIAAHAIETPRLLLMSRTNELKNGVANTSELVGKNLMDHICYLSWGRALNPLYQWRGPRSSSGIEVLRDGPFRSQWAASRVDIGNEGWGWADGDPFTEVSDLIDGTNLSQLNPTKERWYGSALAQKLNEDMTRMMRFCFLVEQLPELSNKVEIPETPQYFDNLGLPRARVTYGVHPYTKDGFKAAAEITKTAFGQAKIKDYTQFVDKPGFPAFECADGTRFNAYGAGHILGTYRMGTDGTNSVVDRNQRSWDHQNMWLVGSGTFPTIGTGNPTVTIAALCYRTARDIVSALNTGR